jgi:hypothetical protein
MYFPQFLLGMFATSAVVAISAYMTTGSMWQALAWSILTLIVLQLGYFGLVVWTIYRPDAEGAEADPGALDAVRPRRRDGVRP